MNKSELNNYINTNIIDNNEGSITAAKLKNIFLENTNNSLTVNEILTLTSQEKNNVLTSLGIADERVNLTLTCDNPSSLIGATVTVSYEGTSDVYTWSGSTLIIIIPMMETYTIHFSNVIGYYTPEDISFFSKKNKVRNITVSYDSAIFTDLSMRDIYGNIMPLRETANCYIIKENGFYEFPLVYGCGIMSGETNTNAYTQLEGVYTSPFYNYLNNQIVSPFIEEDTNTDISSCEVVLNDNANAIISDIQLISKPLCKFIRFRITSVPSLGGNLTLAVKDSNGQIMWSWHLWFYPFTLTTKPHTNTKNKTYNFLDVNLGWVKHASDSKYGTNPYFQWGRKDPMLRPKAYNSNTQATISQGSFNITSCANSLAATIQNPNVFNTYESTHYNWWTNNGTPVDFYNYWDASQTKTGNEDKTIIKTIYDPCPVGFNVPCGNAYLGFSIRGGGVFDYGLTWDERYFPSSGYRGSSSGGIGDVGGNGNYWLASSCSQSSAYSLYFNSSDVNPQNSNIRAYGFSVVPCARPQNFL